MAQITAGGRSGSRDHAATGSAASHPRHGRVLIVGLGRLTAVFLAGMRSGEARVEVAEEAAEALEAAKRLKAELILVGASVEGDPFHLIRELRAAHPAAKILFLAPSSRPEPALQAIASGADDVVPPPHALRSVLLRVEILQDRDRPRVRFPRSATQVRMPRIVIDRLSRLVKSGDEPVSLTGREFELLERLLEDGGEVVSRERIIADIWGASQSSEAVLDATVHRLRRKIEDNPARPRILVTVRGVGYRLDIESLHVVAV
jgi:DNA-binding response OmpR family regulator